MREIERLPDDDLTEILSLSTHERFLEAQVAAGDHLHPVMLNGKLNFPRYTFANAIISYCAGVEEAFWSDGSLYYVVEEEIAEGLTALAKDIPEFYEICVEICIHNLVLRRSLPDPLLNFAVAQLMKLNLGRDPRLKVNRRPRSKDWLEKFYLWRVVREISEVYRLPISRKEESEPESACDAVAGALTFWGRETQFSEIKNLMTHTNFKRHRIEFEVVGRIRWRKETALPNINRLSPSYHLQARKISLEDLADIVSTLPKG